MESVLTRQMISSKNILGYWGTNTKYEVKFHKSTSLVEKYFENKLFVSTPLIGE